MNEKCDRCGYEYPNKHHPRHMLDNGYMVCNNCYAKFMKLLNAFVIVPPKTSEDEEYWRTHCKNCGTPIGEKEK